MYKNFTRIFCTPLGCRQKSLLAMKLTRVLIIAAFLLVSTAGFAQTVTYKSNHASLKEIITEIRKQTGFNVLVSSKSISNITSLKVNFKNTPLTEVLDKVLAGQPLTYKIEDKTVLIEEKKSPPDTRPYRHAGPDGPASGSAAQPR